MPDISKTLFAFYDLAVSPVSFDFVSFMVCAEQARLATQTRDIHFVVVPVGDGKGHHDNEQFDTDHRDWRLRNVVLPMCDLLPASREFTICGSRNYAKQIYDRLASNVFPQNYAVDAPVERHHTGWSIIAAHKGQNVQCLRASEQARAYARQWLDQRAGEKKSVAITLREAPFGINRNSDIQQWSEFTRLLRRNDYFPILLRDIDTALDKTPSEFGDITIFPEGVFNLELRMGLYEECNLCAFVANGPAQICWYNPNIHFLYQVTGDWLENKPTPFNRIGIDFDETPPVANFFQRWIWKSQSAENLFNELIKLDADLEKSHLDGSYGQKLSPILENRRPLSDLSKRYLNWANRTFFTSPQEVALAEACVDVPSGDGLSTQGTREQILYLFNSALRANDLEKAAQYLIVARDKLGRGDDISIKLGILNEAQGNFEVAIEYYQSALDSGCRDISLLFRLATTYTALDRLEDASQIFESIIKNGGKSVRVILELGKIYEKTQTTDFAVNFYADAVKMGITDPRISERITALT